MSAELHKVVIAGDALEKLASQLESVDARCKVFILVDENTRKFCLPLLISRLPFLANAPVLEMRAGEEHKTLAVIEDLALQLLNLGADRNSLLLNLGGGVVGDVGGLLASLFMRGISFIQLPTSLMAMVDASVGGKTGVNLRHHKNLLGVFSKPEAVFIDAAFLATLPADELRSGFAEIIKHSCIANVPSFEQLPKQDELHTFDWLALINSAISFKLEVVESDFKDHHQRKILNFGHTIGHALEGYSMLKGNKRLLHGEAIALGMQVELLLSAHYCGLPMPIVRKWIQFIKSHFPDLLLSINKDSFLDFLHADKKKSASRILCVLLNESGKPQIDFPVEEEAVLTALEAVIVNCFDTVA